MRLGSRGNKKKKDSKKIETAVPQEEKLNIYRVNSVIGNISSDTFSIEDALKQGGERCQILKEDSTVYLVSPREMDDLNKIFPTASLSLLPRDNIKDVLRKMEKKEDNTIKKSQERIDLLEQLRNSTSIEREYIIALLNGNYKITWENKERDYPRVDVTVNKETLQIWGIQVLEHGEKRILRSAYNDDMVRQMIEHFRKGDIILGVSSAWSAYDYMDGCGEVEFMFKDGKVKLAAPDYRSPKIPKKTKLPFAGLVKRTSVCSTIF